MRIHQQLFERWLLATKRHTFNFHTQAPFSTVLAVLPHKAKLVLPLMRQLTRKADFDLEAELKKYRVEQKDREIAMHSDIITKNSIYGVKFDKTTQYLVRVPQSGNLSISNALTENDELLGVLLYGPLQTQKIRYVNENYWHTNEMLLKLFVLVLLWRFFKTIEMQTRPENFNKLEKKK